MVRFPIATLLAGTLFLGTIGGVYFWIVEDQDIGRQRYHQLLQMANPINAKVDPTSYTAKQKRTGIQKSFHFTPPGQDVQHELRMFAANSELLLNRGEESEVVEKMEELRAMIQESLYFLSPEGKELEEMCEGCIPSQKITYLQSEAAQCHYTHGILEASQAEITRFTLSGHSLINTLEEGNISPYQSATAEKIEVRYSDGKMTLAGNVTIDHHEDKNLLQLTCDSAILFQENKIPVVEAQNRVSLSCNHQYTLKGDFIRYSNGIGYLMRGKERCLLSSKKGDLVRSDRIDLAVNDGTIEMVNPDGNLYLFEDDPIPLEFTSHRLLWNHQENRLVLYTDVQVSHPSLGHLQNPDVIHIFRGDGKREGDFEKIISEGKTVLTRDDTQTQRYYTLTCDGRVEMDHNTGIMTFRADDPLASPVHLKDDFGEIFADKAEIIYTPLQGKIKTPEKVILTGNVKIVNKSGAQADSSTILHMALADKVELTPQSNEIVFYSKRKNRVLFYDKGNDLQISAPKLKVRRDKRTKKESFEGAGDVRFSFQDREIALLREKFSLPFTSQKDEKK